MSGSTTGISARVVAVLDGTRGGAERQARALGGFLREGLTVGGGSRPDEITTETLVFYSGVDERERLVGLAPTHDVRLVATGSRRVDLMVERLVGVARADRRTLFLFAAGPTGTELATRLARRTRGAVLTEALDAEIGPVGLACQRNLYSAHMAGRFELAADPCCVTIDAGWYDAASSAGVPHRVLSDDAGTDSVGAPPFDDVELVESPTGGELAEARFLVVAGYGAGSREGVQRIEAAAQRMGADFGVTRPVAMNAWATMDRLVGVSGTRSAPALCVVAGASGAPAFLWGIERAGLIVAVNPDDRAAIAGESDAVVLDDGVAVVEALADLVVAGRAGR